MRGLQTEILICPVLGIIETEIMENCKVFMLVLNDD